MEEEGGQVVTFYWIPTCKRESGMIFKGLDPLTHLNPNFAIKGDLIYSTEAFLEGLCLFVRLSSRGLITGSD